MKQISLVKRLIAAGAVLFLSFGLSVQAQQLPDPSFEDWSGATYDGNIQPKHWHGSNVTQVGFMFNFTHQVAGRTGKAVKVQTQEVGAAGITESAPGYFSLGQPWAYLPSITEVNKATAGTGGGISFVHRPDTMAVWVKRTGDNTDREDFHLLFYSWTGTSKGASYLGKNGKCTEYEYASHTTNEESDIRQALDKNGCQTREFANQVAEGWWRERASYNDWTLIKVPIYYMNSDVPEMCNVIFSASNYPNFRANSGLYVGNTLIVDDVQLIYASTIQQLYVGNKLWKGFDPNSTEEQVYSLGNATTIPDFAAVRGAGELTNTRGETVKFQGRRLADNEISVVKGEIDGAPTLVTIKATDGSSSRTYKIKFISKPSNNAKLADILIDGVSLANFQGFLGTYDVKLPYGTTKVPVVSYVAAEDGQTITITQPTSTTGTCTINVTAPDGTTKMTYTLKFSVAQLDDNTLADIKINGESLANFRPKQNNYTIELPLGTTTLPTIEAVSAYPAGEQTITHTKPSVIDGGKYQITVKAPGNATARTYTLTFKVTASTNTALKDLQVEGFDINYNSSIKTYYVSLPLGTTALPKITYVAGDEWQTITADIPTTLEGTASIRVKSASGAEAVYKIIFQLTKSEVNWLNDIKLDGVSLAGFDRDVFTYTVELPIGTTTLPKITYVAGDEYQTVTIREGGVEGTTRITVTAQDGSSNVYQIQFSVLKANNAKLKMIYVDGVRLADFDANKLEYYVTLPQGTASAPVVTWDAGDEWQTITVRQATSTSGEARITVRPQSGSAQTYIIHFSVNTSNNTALKNIYLDGKEISAFGGDNFEADKLNYEITLPEGVSTIPTITFEKAEEVQKVFVLEENTTVTLRVTAESGDTRTYTLTFIIQKSANAFLKNIFIDGNPLPGFQPEQLTGYRVTLGATTPVITVEKEAGQMVTIIVPAGAGKASILVQPEIGSANTYVIDIEEAVSMDLLLTNIFVDGKALDGFNANTFEYTLSYEATLPIVTAPAVEDGAVTVVTNQDKVLVVSSKGKKSVTYTLHFTQTKSSVATLKSILLDGEALTLQANTFTYSKSLPAGASFPVVTFVKGHARQTVTAGRISETEYALYVTAEDGTKQTYTLQFTQEKFDDATLMDITYDGKQVPGFAPTKIAYTIAWAAGKALPTLEYKKREGERQTILMSQTKKNEQQIIVVAESGKQLTYTITYDMQLSSNTSLKALWIDGDQPFPGFKPDVKEYTYSIDDLGVKVVPVLTPFAAEEGQVITIHYGGLNQVTRIQVVAPDGKASAEYKITFVQGSSDVTTLATIDIENATNFMFDPEVLSYDVKITAGTTPVITYEREEASQSIEVIQPPVGGDSTKVIVTAGNGDKRTYSFYFEYKAPAINENSISVNGEKLDLTKATKIDASHYELAVNLPYGETNMSVYCLAEMGKTYLIQPGGIHHNTIVTFYSNKAGESDIVYTLKPQVATTNPAHLTSISVNGTPLAEFDPERLSYIVPMETYNSTHIVTYTAPASVEVIPVPSSKQYRLYVRTGEYENIYLLNFYYKNEVIPNGEFTSWTTAQYNDAPKPTGWTVLADVCEKFSSLGSYTFGKEVENVDNNIVHLQTRSTSLITSLGGVVPSLITLGTINATLDVAGRSEFTPVGNIPFHNSPDTLSINYQLSKVSTQNHIIYTVTGDKGGYELSYHDTEELSKYVTRVFPLQEINDSIGIPSTMNITINSYKKEGSSNDLHEADMYVDWVRFAYNNKLSGVQVNGDDAKFDGAHTFTYEMDDFGYPTLKFIGEVSDQAQQLTWHDEVTSGDKATRKVDIRNFGEDGNYTDYVLNIIRPLYTSANLSGITIDNRALSGFKKDVYTYEYTISGAKPIPSVMVELESSLQHAQITRTETHIKIIVTAESGATQTYTINLKRAYNNDATLAALIADGVTYDPAITTYEVATDVLPTIAFEKKYDEQTVHVSNGVVTVTAEDGTKKTYTITLKPLASTSEGNLAQIVVDGMPLEGFDKNTLEYEAEQPIWTSFTREVESDVVTQVIYHNKITWTVNGASQKTYTLTFESGLSDETNLGGVNKNDKTYDDFYPSNDDCEITSDEGMDIELVLADKEQEVSITYADNVFTIDVVAANGTKRSTPYKLAVGEDISTVSTLSMIYLDGTPINDFLAEKTKYDLPIPCEMPKKTEPLMPIITYDLGQEDQTVEIELGTMGQSTILTVTSESGNTTTYELNIYGEKSSYAFLSALLVDGKLIEGFKAEKHVYSVQSETANLEVTFGTEDNFQKVTTTKIEEGYEITVEAQNGNKDNYTIVVNAQPSNDTSLKNILLDGKTFSEYDSQIGNFNPKVLEYNIHLPSTASELPDVFVQLNANGQTYRVEEKGDDYIIHVTAADGVTTDDYILHFLRTKSNNTNLSMIYVDGEELAGFDASRIFYTYSMPISAGMPNIDFVKAESAQQTTITIHDNVVTCIVTAEDGTTQKTYMVQVNFEASDISTLANVFEDDVPLANFKSDSTYYYTLLPIGIRTTPVISYELGEAGQSVVMNMINTATTTTYQLTVTAENGTNKTTYTLVYEIQLSAVDTLQMIYLDNQELADFDARLMDYTIVVPDMNTLPTITWEAGDAYQTVTLDTLESANPLAVQAFALRAVAENGASRTYNITFTKSLSSNANLEMIAVGGVNIDNFDSEVLNYTVALPYGTTTMPAVTYTKGEETQNVTLTVNGFTVQVMVVAEDGVTTQIYTINADVKKSDNAFLQNILLDNVSLVDFDPQVQEYFITLPYGTEAWPEVTWVAGNEQQTIALEKDSAAGVFTISVTSGDELNTSDYVLYFTIQPSSICTLDDLMINGVTVEGFAPEVNEYYIIWAPETSEDALYTSEDITYVLTDATATVAITAQDAFTITVIVTAADGVTMNAYIIHQEISLPNNAYLADLQLDGVTIKGFDPTVFDYEYLLLDGGIMPVVTAEAQDSTAEVAVTMGEMGDTTFVYCTAQDGTEYIYTIYIHYADMQITKDATAGDCLIKHIPGTNQFFAATTRQGMKIALYSIYGQFIGMWDVPICDPNAVQWTSDFNGDEIMLDVDLNSTGRVITLEHTQHIYVYTFIQNDEVLVKSGKLAVGR